MKSEKGFQKNNFGKRSFGAFTGSNYESGSGSSSNKKPAYGKPFQQNQDTPQGQEKNGNNNSNASKKKCTRCLGPHLVQDYKWPIGACFACGKVGHRVSEC